VDMKTCLFFPKHHCKYYKVDKLLKFKPDYLIEKYDELKEIV